MTLQDLTALTINFTLLLIEGGDTPQDIVVLAK